LEDHPISFRSKLAEICVFNLPLHYISNVVADSPKGANPQFSTSKDNLLKQEMMDELRYQ
jgi:hypothetical protein